MENPLQRPTFILVLALNIFITTALYLEKLVSKRSIPEEKAKQLIIANIVIILITPIVVNTLFVCNLLLSSLVCSIYSVVILKLISYHSVNYWCRTGIRYGKPIDSFEKKVKEIYIKSQDMSHFVKYPENIGLIDLYYFMFAPTLCYQINFPRTPRIRKRFVLKRLIEYVRYVSIQVWSSYLTRQSFNIVDSHANYGGFSSTVDYTRSTEIFRAVSRHGFLQNCFKTSIISCNSIGIKGI